MSRAQKLGLLFITVLAIAVCGIWYVALAQANEGELTVAFLDIGQGDATFIESPAGVQVLIDGGKGGSVLRELASVMPFGDRSIDIVIATHPDGDHIGGLIDVLERYEVAHIIESGVQGDTPLVAKFETVAVEEAAERTIALRGQRVSLGGGAYLEVLFPDRSLPNVETNLGSVVARLVYGETVFMLTGDSPIAIEQYLASLDRERLASNVLKVGHHGSKTSTSPLFVGFVDPQYGVISRGCDNSYGHPHQEVLDTLAKFAVQTLDTCEEGTVIFTSDGKEVVRR